MIRTPLACLVALSLTSIAVANERDSAARFFPAHTYVYAEINPVSGARGLRGLKLAKLLTDPTIRGLVQQALRQVPRRADPRAMLRRYPLDKAIGDCIALGAVGFVARTRATETTPARVVRFPEDGPVDRRMFRGRVNVQADVMLAIKVSDKQLFMKTVMELMTNLVCHGQPPEIGSETADGLELETWPVPGLGELYSSFVGDWFLMAQSPKPLAGAIRRAKTRTASLLTRSDLQQFAKHRGKRATAGFVHIGLDSAIDLFSPLIRKRDREELAMWGAFDYSGLQVGMGFDHGAVCEWFQLALAENPKGIFLNLARLLPSTATLEKQTQRGTVHAASLTLDFAALYKSIAFLVELCGGDMRSFERDVARATGFDLREDLLGAIGPAMGGMVVMPKLGVIPEPSLVIKVRNRAKMEKVLSAIVAGLEAGGVRTRRFTVPGGGPKGTYVRLGGDIPLKPAFALSRDALVISTTPLMLKSALTPSRKTGLAVCDLLPDASRPTGTPMMSWFVDPAPLATNLYADALKLADMVRGLLPVEPAELPSLEFLGQCVSRIGFECSIDPYFMSLDLHSPTGIALPLLLGGIVAIRQQKQGSIH